METFTMSILDYLKLVQKLWRYLTTWKFRRIFGKDAGKKYHLIYNYKYVKNRSDIFQSPESKIKRYLYRNMANLESINPCADTRSISYLVYSFGETIKVPPVIVSEVDVDKKMEISFVSIGGVTNRKTCDLLEEVSYLLKFNGDSIMHGNSTLVTANQDVDYAFIIKTHPQTYPEQTWICCAGVGEWGTSGAAWFLARKWKSIHKWAKDKPFVIITKTVKRCDEKTQLVHKYIIKNTMLMEV